MVAAPCAPHHGLVLAPAALPRASTLTDLLVGGAPVDGCGAGPVPSPDELAEVGRRLEHRLAASGAASGPAGRTGGPTTMVRVTGHLLRTTFRPGPGPGRGSGIGSARPGPAGAGHFAWSAISARRPVGLAAVRRCLEGGARWPAEAVAGVIEDLAADGHHGLGTSGSLPGWLGSLPPPALAVVRAEAVTWATQLWSALEWERLGDRVEVGAPERHWTATGPATVTLRRRVDVRIADGSAFLTMLPGWPGDASRVELGLAALVAAVSAPSERLPERVAGWWPESGRALVVPVDRSLLEETVIAVARAVSVTRATGSDRARSADRTAPTPP